MFSKKYMIVIPIEIENTFRLLLKSIATGMTSSPSESGEPL